MKRVVVIADLHCGHRMGLTPPDFSPAYPKSSPEYAISLKRRRLWKFYADALAALQPVDVLIVNGDAVDGKGDKSGGTELLTTSRNEQAEMAAAAINEAKASKVFMTYGTPYHTGLKEDWEDAVADKTHNVEKIGGHDWIEVNGLVFDYRHYVGRSIIPHGRFTQLAREYLWTILWAEHGEYPKSDVLLRSHVHYHVYCGGFGWFAATTPALQAAGTKLGVRRMSGTVDFGLLSFDVTSREDWSWNNHILKLNTSRRHIITV